VNVCACSLNSEVNVICLLSHRWRERGKRSDEGVGHRAGGKGKCGGHPSFSQCDDLRPKVEQGCWTGHLLDRTLPIPLQTGTFLLLYNLLWIWFVFEVCLRNGTVHSWAGRITETVVTGYGWIFSHWKCPGCWLTMQQQRTLLLVDECASIR
jgi:hypothetical protein